MLCLLVAIACTANSAVVKMTASKICHPEASPYYQRTTNYTGYPSVQACLDAGGRLPKKMNASNYKARPVNSATAYSKATSAHVVRTSSNKYKRENFGRGWADFDHDGQDSRQETLIAQSTAPVHFKSAKHRKVAAGRWISPFTNAVIHDPSKIDIDHIVPLKWAWDHGAGVWSQQKRKQFANDPANLISVEASLNRQKGAKGPDKWLPPTNRCEYVLRFLRVAKKYGVEVPTAVKSVRQRVCR